MTEFEIWLDDPEGNRLALLDKFLSAKWARVVNNLGAWSIVLPDTFDENLFRIDGLVEFWRRPTGGVLTLDRVGQLRYPAYKGQRDGQDALIIGGYDMMDLLQTRIIAYDEDSSEASKDDYLDDMLTKLEAQKELDHVKTRIDDTIITTENLKKFRRYAKRKSDLELILEQYLQNKE